MYRFESDSGYQFMKHKALPEFKREEIFAAVDASNLRFNDYTEEQRREFLKQAKSYERQTETD